MMIGYTHEQHLQVELLGYGKYRSESFASIEHPNFMFAIGSALVE